MKIAHVIATFPPHIGGMGSVALAESTALAERGHDLTVFTLQYLNTQYADTGALYAVVRLRPLIKAGDAGFVPKLFLELGKFDLVHLHYPFYGGAEWVLLANLLKRQKYIVTYHMQAAPRGWFKALVGIAYDLLFRKLILGWAEKVLVVDRNYFDKFVPYYFPTEQLLEFPNPIDTALFKPGAADASAPESSKKKKTLLFVGNLMPVKRLDLLIAALERLNDETVLTVVGDGYDAAMYHRIVHDRKLDERVKFVGRCEPRELVRYYQAAWCTVVPSQRESFSLVIAESLATGTPVIASNIPGIQNRVDDGKDGLLFQSGAVDSLVEKIQRILALTPEQRKAMGEWGRRKVVQKYGLEQHVEKLEKIYSSVITRSEERATS